MATKRVLTIYKGRNSPQDIVVKQNGAAVAFTDLITSSVSVVIDGVEYSSNDGYATFTNDGTVTLTLGSLTDIASGKRTVRLVMYSPQYPNGRVLLSEKTDYRLVLDFA